MNGPAASPPSDDRADSELSHDEGPEGDPPPLLAMLDLDDIDEGTETDLTLELGSNVVTATDARTDLGADDALDLPAIEHLASVVGAVLRDEGVERSRLDLHFVDRDVIAELNEEHLGGEGPTDVLSFPLDPDDFVAPVAAADEPRHLGDVVVCPVVADAQAADHAGSYDAELTLLVVHGVLHLLGHDHADPDDAARMMERERVHLRPYGHEHPGEQAGPS